MQPHRSLDNELIVVALKGADDAVSDKFFACMSQRAAANIKDEMELWTYETY